MSQGKVDTELPLKLSRYQNRCSDEVSSQPNAGFSNIGCSVLCSSFVESAVTVFSKKWNESRSQQPVYSSLLKKIRKFNIPQEQDNQQHLKVREETDQQANDRRFSNQTSRTRWREHNQLICRRLGFRRWSNSSEGLGTLLSILLVLICSATECCCNARGIDWSQWWTYDGISGPRFWGVINPAWGMCKDGRRQSPINIDPRTLLFDPNLSPFSVDKVAVEGDLVNTGHSVEWHIRPSTSSSDNVGNSGGIQPFHSSSFPTAPRGSSPQLSPLSEADSNSLLLDPSSIESHGRNYSLISGRGRSGGFRDGRRNNKGRSPSANISGGPLSYTYTLTHARLHFGERDQQGSEHMLDNHAFPAELQIYGYNSQLYRNFSQAVGQVYGIAAVAVLVQLGDGMSPEFQVMMEGVKSIKYGGSSSRTPPLVISGLLPPTQHYMTYEGSITEPACHETVTWIVPNKPMYISLAMMRELRSLRQGDSDPLTHAPIANNFRPVQTAHHRTVRANINAHQDELKEDRCQLADPRLVYRAGSWLGS